MTVGTLALQEARMFAGLLEFLVQSVLQLLSCLPSQRAELDLLYFADTSLSEVCVLQLVHHVWPPQSAIPGCSNSARGCEQSIRYCLEMAISVAASSPKLSHV